MSIEEEVRKTALAFSERKTYFGNEGVCWEFVHAVLYKAGGKSFYDFNNVKEGEAIDVFAPWGNEAKDLKPGYIAIFKGVSWKNTKSETVGRGTITTTREVTTTQSLPKHVAVVLKVFDRQVTKTNPKTKKKTTTSYRVITIAQQGMPAAKAAPSTIDVPVGLNLGGTTKYFIPVAAEKPKKAECPTKASKAVAEEVKGM
jgi:hypothetical protein